MRRLGLAGLALGAGLAPCAAQPPVDIHADPAVWLRQIYALYQRAQGHPDFKPQPSDELVEQRASRVLAALFRRDEDCSQKSNQVCALDWDFVIDGQDWEISHVQVGAMAIAGDKATVTVSFVNLKTPCVNVYAFVREGGDWKVDDIETRPKGEKPASIAGLLRDFKDY